MSKQECPFCKKTLENHTTLELVQCGKEILNCKADKQYLISEEKLTRGNPVK